MRCQWAGPGPESCTKTVIVCNNIRSCSSKIRFTGDDDDYHFDKSSSLDGGVIMEVRFLIASDSCPLVDFAIHLIYV